MIFTPLHIVLAVVAVMAAIGYAVYAEQPVHTVDEIAAHHWARLNELDRMAIERAYVQQVTFLFQQWMKDDMQQPERALRGVRQAQSAYSRAMLAIEKREKP